MRIAVMNPHMRAKYSGPTESMHRIFGALSRIYGFNIVAVGPEIPDNRVRELSYSRISLPHLTGIGGQLVWALKSNLWLWQNRARYDYVHLHGAYTFNLMSAIVPILLGRPFGILPLGVDGDLKDEARSNRMAVLRVLKKSIMRQACIGFALARDNELELLRAGVRKNRVKRLSNPAASQFFRQSPSMSDLSHILVFIGKLGHGKRPDLILEAIRRLRDLGWSDAKAVFIGPFETLEYQEQFMAHISRLHLESAIDTRGYRSDVAAELPPSQCLFVLLSSQEGLPGAMSEAMAWGMPVVVTPVGAMEEIVTESGAGFCISQDPIELADVVMRIWADPTFGRELAARARLYADSHFSEHSVSARFASSLEQLVEK